MIEQYLSITNESATMFIFAKNFVTKQGLRKACRLPAMRELFTESKGAL
jgi:hypothetical protein